MGGETDELDDTPPRGPEIVEAPLPWECAQCRKKAEGIEIALVDESRSEDDDLSIYGPPLGWLVLPIEATDEGDGLLLIEGCCSVECAQALLGAEIAARRVAEGQPQPTKKRRRITPLIET